MNSRQTRRAPMIDLCHLRICYSSVTQSMRKWGDYFPPKRPRKRVESLITQQGTALLCRNLVRWCSVNPETSGQIEDGVQCPNWTYVNRNNSVWFLSDLVQSLITWQPYTINVEGQRSWSQHDNVSAVTRSSAVCRESAHLTWLYCMVQMAFQYETV